MKLHNLIKPAVLSLSCALACSAGAVYSKHHSKHMHKKHVEAKHKEAKHALVAMPKEVKSEGYNFVTIKGGLVSPTSLGGTSGLNTGGVTYTGGIAVGRKFEQFFAIELEYMYRGKNTAKSYATTATPNDDTNSWSASSNTFMANLSADLMKNQMITPYVKVGAGMSANKADNYVSSITDDNGRVNTKTYSGKTTTHFAWQAGAGLNMKATEMFETQLQYMFVDRGSIKTNANYVTSNDGSTGFAGPRTGRLREHVITIGLTTKF
jgi:opacity protein-like surface antigen